MFAGLLHENITMVERINFQKVEVIVIYFLCNPSVTKQRDASDTTQNMLHWQDENKKFELMLTRCTKAYSSTCLQTVSLSPAISSKFILKVCTAAEDRKKSIKPLLLEVLGSFIVINVDTTKKLITSACCDRQHASGDLQPFSLKTGQQQWIYDFYGGTAIWCHRAVPIKGQYMTSY